MVNVSTAAVQAACREQFFLHIEPPMAEFLLAQIGAGPTQLIGCDARTGVPVAIQLPPQQRTAILNARP